MISAHLARRVASVPARLLPCGAIAYTSIKSVSLADATSALRRFSPSADRSNCLIPVIPRLGDGEWPSNCGFMESAEPSWTTRCDTNNCEARSYEARSPRVSKLEERKSMSVRSKYRTKYGFLKRGGSFKDSVARLRAVVRWSI